MKQLQNIQEEPWLKRWFKSLFSVQSLALIVAIGSLLVGVHQLWLSRSGKPVVKWEGEAVSTERNVFYTYIYTNGEKFLPLSPFFAVVSNPEQLVAKELSVKYLIEDRGVNILFSEEFKHQHTIDGRDELRNRERSLPAFEELSAPIEYVELNRGSMGRLIINFRLTCNEIEEPIEYTHFIYLCQLNKRKFREQALADFKSRMNEGDLYSLYLYTDLDGFERIDLSTLANGDGNTPSTASQEEEAASRQPQPPQLGVLMN